jgi:phage-related protein
MTKKIMSEWTFGGTRLADFGAVTELDAYLDMPAKRGDNILIPMAHGRVWVPKFFDQRIVSFGIEISADDVPALEQKMDALKALLGSRVQQALVNQFCDGARSAGAEVLNALGVTRDPDPLVAKVVIDFLLADPFFRSSVLTTKTFTAASSPYTLNNPGTAEERFAIITFTGPLSNPIVTNTTNGVVLQYDAVLAAGSDIVTVDCEHFTAVDETAANVVGSIVHSGDTAFMTLAPGDNVMTLAGAGGGSVQIDFYPPYL